MPIDPEELTRLAKLGGPEYRNGYLKLLNRLEDRLRDLEEINDAEGVDYSEITALQGYLCDRWSQYGCNGEWWDHEKGLKYFLDSMRYA